MIGLLYFYRHYALLPYLVLIVHDRTAVGGQHVDYSTCIP